jgi:hypothetical protein
MRRQDLFDQGGARTRQTDDEDRVGGWRSGAGMATQERRVE